MALTTNLTKKQETTLPLSSWKGSSVEMVKPMSQDMRLLGLCHQSSVFEEGTNKFFLCVAHLFV